MNYDTITMPFQLDCFVQEKGSLQNQVGNIFDDLLKISRTHQQGTIFPYGYLCYI
jgi:hypothetical protein